MKLTWNWFSAEQRQGDDEQDVSRHTEVEDIQPLVAQSKSHQRATHVTQEYALLLIVLLCIVVFHTLNIGSSQFIGSQGWAYVLGGGGSTSDPNILKGISKRSSLTAGTTTHKLTPQKYVNLIMQKMSLDQKLGQMMIVQFLGPSYSFELNTMIKQYNVGTVLIFTTNQNIVSKNQLKSLIQQMQGNSPIPLAGSNRPGRRLC